MKRMKLYTKSSLNPTGNRPRTSWIPCQEQVEKADPWEIRGQRSHWKQAEKKARKRRRESGRTGTWRSEAEMGDKKGKYPHLRRTTGERLAVELGKRLGIWRFSDHRAREVQWLILWNGAMVKFERAAQSKEPDKLIAYFLTVAVWT